MALFIKVHIQSQPPRVMYRQVRAVTRYIGMAVPHALCWHIRVSQSASQSVGSTAMQYYSWHNEHIIREESS